MQKMVALIFLMLTTSCIAIFNAPCVPPANLAFIEMNGLTQEGESLIVPVIQEDDGTEYVRLDSPFTVKLWKTQNRIKFNFIGCIIYGQLHLPSTIEEVVLSNCIIQGGIHFENQNGRVYKNREVIVGPIVGGTIVNQDNF